MDKVQLRVLHPTNETDADISADDAITLAGLVCALAQNGFIDLSNSYSALVSSNGSDWQDAEQSKTLKELGIVNGYILKIVKLSTTDSSHRVDDRCKEPIGETIKLLRIGIPIKDVKPIDASKLSHSGIGILLHEYLNAETENKEWQKKHETNFTTISDERDKLRNTVQRLEIHLAEKRISIFLITVAQIVMALGVAYVTKEGFLIPSLTTIVASISMTCVGLWFSFRNQKK